MIWMYVLGYGLMGAVFGVLAWRPSMMAGGRQFRGHRFAKRFRVDVAPGDVADFDAMLDAGDRRLGVAMTSGCVVAGAVGITLELTSRGDGGTTLLMTLVVLTLLAQLASVLGEIAINRASSSRRTAHLRAASVHMYVNPFLRISVAMMAIGGAIVAYLSTTQPVPDVAQTFALASVPLSLLTVSELGARILVVLPEGASKPAFLYVRDALRSQFLNGLFVNAAWMSALCLGVAMSAFEWGYPADLLPIVLGLAAYLALESGTSSPYRRFRLYFWPRLDQGEIVVTAPSGALA